MQRQPEPELMDDPEQAQAYAQADFDAPHSQFMALFHERFGDAVAGLASALVLDLGCGPGDITCRFARHYPNAVIDALDGAPAMLQLAAVRVQQQGVSGRINLWQRHLPDVHGLAPCYDVIISNSLLHHLHDPMVLWHCIQSHLRPGTQLFVMDLLRPASVAAARRLVAENAGDEPTALQHDFYNSLLAAYRLDEVQAQVLQAGLGWLRVEQVSDRHFAVSGRAPILLG